jgi:hypothetical protein
MIEGEAENTKLSLPVSEFRDHIQGPATASVTDRIWSLLCPSISDHKRNSRTFRR